MTFEEIDAYLQRLFLADRYTDLDSAARQKIVFTAQEILSDGYKQEQLTPRLVGLQTLYMLEGESEEFAMLRRQGVSQASTKDASVTMAAGSDIAPSVIAILGPVGGDAGIGAETASVSEMI